MKLTEDAWEHLALDDLSELFWTVKHGKEIAPGASTAVGPDGQPVPERESWDELLIPTRLRTALRALNPDVPREYLDQAFAAIVAPTSNDAIAENKRVHDFLTDGFRGISYVDADGLEQNPTIRLVSSEPSENDWLAANQVTVVRGDVERRFDVVLYLNGLPVSVIELKNAGTRAADLAAAHAQVATYVRELPLVFRFVVLTLVSDGITARYGTPFTPFNHFSPWNVDDDGRPVGTSGRPDSTQWPDDAAPADDEPVTALRLALYGVFDQLRFLQLLHGYVAFDEGSEGLSKRVAKPHQYFAVSKAVEKTITAVASDGKAGVVWHTQGSGKSMEMELYTNQVMRHPRLRNPTVVVVTDRTELDGQLYETFRRSQLLPEEPRQIRRREELRTELAGRVTGGIYFTTLQKFGLSPAEKQAGTKHPLLSDRRNIVVVVDEAHRSHYDDLDGYAWHLKSALPHATLIAFTGTPVSTAERDTRAVFGEDIDVYDLSRAVHDGATVPVYFDSRLVKVDFVDGADESTIDAAADEMTTGLDDAERRRIESSVAVVNAIYGAPARLEALAVDLVAHWEGRRAAMFESLGRAGHERTPGKALVVGATREICARLYAQIVALRPDWHSDDLATGKIKVVYSGTPSDPLPIRDHVRRDSENAAIKQRLKDPDDELEIVIVKDMMLTGFDSPPLHTLYLDRPIKGALLMQTLARVNRTFRGKTAGLLVAYAPVAENLAAALREYSPQDQATRPLGRQVEEAVALAELLVSQVRATLSGFDWRARFKLPGERAYVLAVHATVNHLRDPGTVGNRPEDVEDGSDTLGATFRRQAGQLHRAWALAGGAGHLSDIADDVRFFEEVRVWMGKFDAEDRQARGEAIPDDVQRMLNQLVAESVDSGEVLDIYQAAGMESPRIDEIDTSFLATAAHAENPHLAIEALRKVIQEESRAATRNNLVRQRAFSDRLNELMTRYTNSNLTSAEVIAALIEMAHEVTAEGGRGDLFSPPLNSDELAFYDAVATNESAVEVQGDGVLADIARELLTVLRRDVRTDWTVREDVRAKLRSSIKRLLVKHGYPPDKQPGAIKLVMEQMESMAPRYAEREEGAA